MLNILQSPGQSGSMKTCCRLYMTLKGLVDNDNALVDNALSLKPNAGLYVNTKVFYARF